MVRRHPEPSRESAPSTSSSRSAHCLLKAAVVVQGFAQGDQPPGMQVIRLLHPLRHQPAQHKALGVLFPVRARRPVLLQTGSQNLLKIREEIFQVRRPKLEGVFLKPRFERGDKGWRFAVLRRAPSGCPPGEPLPSQHRSGFRAIAPLIPAGKDARDAPRRGAPHAALPRAQPAPRRWRRARRARACPAAF